MNEVEKKITEIDSQIQQKQAELEELYKKANTLFEIFDITHERYETKQEDKIATVTKLKGNEYFRKPMATAITLILEDWQRRNMGPASLEEICAKLEEGGYDFDGKDPKIAVGTAMGKNPKFARIPKTDKWVLDEHHPKVGRRGRPKGLVEGETLKRVSSESTENNITENITDQETINEEHQNQTEGANVDENK